MNMRTAAMAALACTVLSALPVGTAQAATVDCKLTFQLSGWSVIYKRAEGTGMVRCENGQTAPVKISVVGGGLTAGKYHIDNGIGEISDVNDISEVFGDYAQAGAEAGLVKSAHAQVLTKGNVSLALSGTGQGIDLGVSAGRFTISRR